jgi:hypothetical protein
VVRLPFTAIRASTETGYAESPMPSMRWAGILLAWDAGRLGVTRRSGVVLATALMGVGLSVGSAAGAVTERVSLSTAGAQANAASVTSAMSTDGRFVVFSSSASNLVGGDANSQADVFVRDRVAAETSLVSVSSSGVQANEDSLGTGISGDGRYVVFESPASNLVAGDNTGSWDVFLRDRTAGVTQRVSVSPTGQPANDESFGSVISTDGRFVAFSSGASNLVRGDTNGRWDTFVWDRNTGVTRLVSLSSHGTQAQASSSVSSISSDGRLVVFTSRAANLVSGDTNRATDVFVRNRATGQTRRVNLSSTDKEANSSSSGGAISADGHLVSFESDASNLVSGDTNGRTDVFVRNRATGRTHRVSVSSAGRQGSNSSEGAAIAAQGRYVAFWSHASNLVAGDTNGHIDVFVHDRATGTTRRVSVSPTGAEANGRSWWVVAISADGRVVAFRSAASNLVPGDTNNSDDAFVRVRS